MGAHIERLDGNALAGILTELMSTDASMLQVTCGHCGRRGDMADVTVERDDVGAIVRCVGCGHTLLVVLRAPAGGIRLRIEGAAEIATI